MKSLPPTPDAVRGVFAYLDASLPQDLKHALSACELHRDSPSFYDWQAAPMAVFEHITNEFRLMYPLSPIREALERYRLYHKTDMAKALTCAYRLHLRGEDPGEALSADYCLSWFGILTWTTKDALRQAHDERPERSLWSQFGQFYRDGDRFIRYSSPTSYGTLLVRGDRLVWEIEEMHMNRSRPSPKFKAEAEKFRELGGNAAFLAGQFDWPPPGWVNPVTDEQEAGG